MTDGTKLTLRNRMPIRQIKSLLEDAKYDQRINQVELSDIHIFPLIAHMVVNLLKCRRWETIRFFRCSDRVDLVAQAAAKQSNILILDRCNLNAGLAHGNPSLVESVAQQVHLQSQLTSLHILQYTFVCLEEMQAFAQGLAIISSLKELNVSDCRFLQPPQVFTALIQGLAANDCLEMLNFKSCGLSDEQVVDLVEAVSDNRNLKSLDLSYNHVDSNGSTALGALLLRNRLQVLILNATRHLEITSLVNSLQDNTSLRELHLQDNFLNDEQLVQIANLLHRPNLALKVLLLLRCNVYHPVIEKSILLRFLLAVQVNFTIQRLELSETHFIFDPDVTHLLREILVYTTLNHARIRRQVLQITTTTPRIPVGCWPLILAKTRNPNLLATRYAKNVAGFGSHMEATTLYFLLRNGPFLMSS
jgi:hypothetical protein